MLLVLNLCFPPCTFAWFGRYAAAAECAAAVPEKTQPGGEQEQAANALEVRATVRIECLNVRRTLPWHMICTQTVDVHLYPTISWSFSISMHDGCLGQSYGWLLIDINTACLQTHFVRERAVLQADAIECDVLALNS